MITLRLSQLRTWQFALASLFLVPTSPTLHANIVAVDGDVPVEFLNVGGTALAPALYIIGDSAPHAHQFDTYAVVGGNSHTHLIVRNQSTITGHFLYIDFGGMDNRVIIEDGSVGQFASVLIGSSTGSLNHQLHVTGSGSLLQLLTLDLGNVSSGHTVLVENGGRIETELYAYIGGTSFGNHNRIHVTGQNSVWTHAGALEFKEGQNCSLLVSDGGLVIFGDPIQFGTGTDNFVGLDQGVLAFQGDIVSDLHSWVTEERLRVWDPESGMWVTAGLDDLILGYFADEETALALTGYEGLAGHSIVFANTAIIPEPTAFAIVLAGIVLVFVATSRHRLRS